MSGALIGILFFVFCFFAPHLFIGYSYWFSDITNLPLFCFWCGAFISALVFIIIARLLIHFVPEGKKNE